MIRYLLILFIISVLTTVHGCSKDDSKVNLELIFGEWRIDSVDGSSEGYDKNVIYVDFYKNSTISVCYSEDNCPHTSWEFVSGSPELLELANSNYLFFTDNNIGFTNRPNELILIKSINQNQLSIDVIKKENKREVDRKSIELSK